MSGIFQNIRRDHDPMRLIREARERGVEPKMAAGFDPAGGGAIVVMWHIPDTDEWVMEGTWTP